MVHHPPSTFMAHVTVPVDMQIQAIVWSSLPNTLIPRVAAATGITTASGEPAYSVMFDFPQQIAARVDKPTQELRDVDAFLRDTLPAARIASACIRNPDDPPDVLAFIDGNEFGIEATQFLPPDSELDPSNSVVGRWMTFEGFRDKVYEQNPATLSQHRGLLVVANFGRFNASAADRLPPRRSNLGSTIAALRAAVPVVREGSEAAAAQVTLQESEVFQWSSDRSLFFTWTALPPWYSSDFCDRMGFELALGYHATVTQTDLRNELHRLIEGHDSGKTDTLVVTINAPLKSGLEFPSNKLAADMLFDDESPLDGWAPDRIENIALHDQAEHRVKWLLGGAPWG
ncbi:hypothetical protein [Mycobacteroides abscessus]|uniref:hypothetical protein n=1 Tax=Mycobacteroides abscessus TaxID=36809 RepID=UPI0011C39FD6|nr:hypothetical protein [Mycobacteroides abscessus]